jgi:hypothetical protein
MSGRSKRSNNNDTNEGNTLETMDEFMPPFSPITSPIHKNLTKRQEQNRAAQRAFRERRAQTLKEMEMRLGRLERVIEEFTKSITKINLIEKELIKLNESVSNLYLTMDSLTVPTWTVPNSEDLKEVVEPEPIGAVLGALRPSSTDPTLTATSH